MRMQMRVPPAANRRTDRRLQGRHKRWQARVFESAAVAKVSQQGRRLGWRRRRQEAQADGETSAGGAAIGASSTKVNVSRLPQICPDASSIAVAERELESKLAAPEMYHTALAAPTGNTQVLKASLVHGVGAAKRVALRVIAVSPI